MRMIKLPWTVWPVFDFTGLEIWNYTSHWRGRARTIARTLFWFLFNRRAAMDGPPAEALRLWDCYIQSGRRTVGIGGTDAHAFKKRLLGLIDVDIFPYRFLFKTINTYICAGTVELVCGVKTADLRSPRGALLHLIRPALSGERFFLLLPLRRCS